MKSKFNSIVPVLMILFMFLSSCASSKYVVLIPTKRDFDVSGKLLISIQDKSDKVFLSPQAKQTLAESIVEKIDNGKKYSSVYLGDDKKGELADLILRCDITANRSVSQTSRILRGSGAGKAYVEIVASFINPKTKEILGSTLFTSESSAHTIFAGTTTQVLDAISSFVANYALGDS